jgi:hypothetical protein
MCNLCDSDQTTDTVAIDALGIGNLGFKNVTIRVGIVTEFIILQ